MRAAATRWPLVTQSVGLTGDLEHAVYFMYQAGLQLTYGKFESYTDIPLVS